MDRQIDIQIQKYTDIQKIGGAVAQYIEKNALNKLFILNNFFSRNIGL